MSSKEFTISLGDLEKEITCAICQDHYTDPRILPCGHYYCMQCLCRLTRRMGSKEPFSCPECRQEVDLKGATVEELKPAFFVNRLKDPYSKLKKAHDSHGMCQACADVKRKGEAFCQQCNLLLLCSECATSHQKENGAHHIVPLGGDKGPSLAETVAKSESKKCVRHGKKLKIFCFTCELPICRDCTVKDHREHEFEFNNIAAACKRNKLMENLKPLKAVKQSLSDRLEAIKTTDDELLAQGDSVADTIKTSFRALHEILEERESQLLEEASIRMDEKRKNLKLQEKRFSQAGVNIQDLINSVESSIKDSSDDELVSTSTNMEGQLKRELVQYCKPGMNFDRLEELDMGVEVRCADMLLQLCHEEAKLTRLQSTVHVNNMATRVEINKSHEFTVAKKLSNNQSVKVAMQVECTLKCLRNGSVCTCAVEPACSPGKYCVKYTPTVRGRHELTVLADGEEVSGSPFPVFVSILPTQLGKPIKVWRGIRKPAGIAVNSANEIIYAEHEGDIVVKNEKGRTIRTIKRSDHNFKCVRGIAVDGDDNIYFTDTTTNKIFKASRDCKKVKVHEVRQFQGSGYLDVSVFGDQVLVCEVGNRGIILVYDRALTYVRQVACAEENTVYLNVFSDGSCIYASHYISPSVHVLSDTGEVLHSLGCDEKGVAVLETPRGGCVWGQYVYVTDADKKEVMVFDATGNYVTSFGNSVYLSVCVDSDGFVYASSFRGNKIDVF